MSKTDLTELKELLSSPKKVAIVSHKNPDGDAMGSSLGLYHHLLSANHSVEVVMPNAYPVFLQWMPGNDKVVTHDGNEKLAENLVSGSDILFCLDFNTPERAGDLEPVIRSSDNVKVMIDHHLEPEAFVHFMLSDTKACSTSELIHRFAGMMGGSINRKESAECLYAGIMTDSGNFRFPSTSASTHRIVADLMDLGVDNAHIYNLVNNTSSEHRLRLLGYCINDKMKVLPAFGTAFISLSMEEKRRFQFQKGDTEGTVNYPLSIDGVGFSVIFIESEDMVKISFRSIGDFDVNRFARAHFDGGGHKNAAGGRSELGLRETVDRFVSILPAYADQLTG